MKWYRVTVLVPAGSRVEQENAHLLVAPVRRASSSGVIRGFAAQDRADDAPEEEEHEKAAVRIPGKENSKHRDDDAERRADPPQSGLSLETPRPLPNGVDLLRRQFATLGEGTTEGVRASIRGNFLMH